MQLSFTETIIDARMSDSEAQRLGELEGVIQRGLNTFVDVGNALLEIRDSRLYRAEFGTFEDYCIGKWNMQRAYAYRLISAAEVVSNLSPIGDILPSVETQARPLTRLEPEQQREAWAKAVETAPNGKVTAAHVQSVVDEIQQKPHVANNSGNNEWYTPPEYIEAAHRVMKEIDLDPASSVTANKTVGASVFYSEDDNGLTRQWAGRVWMNPPYASELIGKFCDKLVGHYIDGDISEAVVLVNNATETGWFNQLIAVADAVVFTKGRIKFVDMDGNRTGAPLQGQAIIYMGEQAEQFLREFSAFGWGAKPWRQ